MKKHRVFDLVDHHRVDLLCQGEAFVGVLNRVPGNDLGTPYAVGSEKICERILFRQLDLVVEEVEVALVVAAMTSRVRRRLENEPRRKELRDERLLKAAKALTVIDRSRIR